MEPSPSLHLKRKKSQMLDNTGKSLSSQSSPQSRNSLINCEKTQRITHERTFSTLTVWIEHSLISEVKIYSTYLIFCPPKHHGLSPLTKCQPLTYFKNNTGLP